MSTSNYPTVDNLISFPRAKHDFYVEPASTVEALFDTEKFIGDIYDPACGQGTILEVAKKRTYYVTGSDIADRGYEPAAMFDFLTIGEQDLRKGLDSHMDNIICNPPFSLAEPFIERALKLARFKVAFLLRLSFLEGQKRRHFFARTPLARVHVCSSRISMPPGDLLARGEVQRRGGTVAFAWFVWEHEHKGPPILGWLP